MKSPRCSKFSCSTPCTCPKGKKMHSEPEAHPRYDSWEETPRFEEIPVVTPPTLGDTVKQKVSDKARRAWRRFTSQPETPRERLIRNICWWLQ